MEVICCNIKSKSRKANKPFANIQAFTLIEIMISLAIISLVLSTIYGVFVSTSRVEQKQAQIIDLQQNMRSSINYMSYFIRLVGVDPLETGGFGFTNNVIQGDDIDGKTARAFTNSTGIAFDYDNNENGKLDNDERTGFRINGNQLEQIIYDGANYNWQVLANNVEILDFVYLDSNNLPMDMTVITSETLDDIRTVEMTLISRSQNRVTDALDNRIYANKRKATLLTAADYQADFRRRKITTTLKIRNQTL